MFYDYSQEENNPHPRHYWLGRHHGGHGHSTGSFDGGFGRGGGGFRSRKFAAADLQLIILALLAEKPSHGYELMKGLEERSAGFYIPSPGMIYPALTYLEEIGYTTVESEGAKKLYHITAAGRRYLEKNREMVDSMLRELERVGTKMERVRRVFAGDDSPSEDEDFDGRGSREVNLARRALKMALHEKRRSSPQEAKRIAEILRRAAAEIAAKP
jgi:DNA-binding PadR family transcriptional regulator